jgi:4-hydroxybenzoate polyprenyltransferase
MSTALSESASPRVPVGRRVATFLDLIKFAHSVFALPFALMATFMASRAIGLAWPGWVRLGLILVCMVAARTFAMTVNRLVDRKFDALNPRTARRPSVTGAISPGFMAAAIFVCALVFLAGTGLFWIVLGNMWPPALALPVLGWIAAYSFTKRFTWLCHFWLGASLGLAPVSAWIAIAPPQGPVIATSIVLLGLGVLFWVAGFDILYALQDEQIDRGAGLNSVPARFGRGGALWLSRVCHALALLAFGGVGTCSRFHLLYWAGFGAAVTLLVVEQSLVRPDDISKVNVAFMTVNGVVGLVFGGLAIADVLLY